MKRLAAVRLFPIAVALALAVALVAPGAGLAATVVNGGFESGDFEGWSGYSATELGDWYAYEGTDPPIGGKEKGGQIPAPPQGSYAAITDEYNPDTVILYQDIVLRPEYEHRLNLLAFYASQEAIATPNPDTLSVDDAVLGGQANQQYRIDVVRPQAPIDSIAPGDVLRAVFQTQPGDPEEMPPTRILASLSAFAGQTVRLRVAVAAHEETLNAGVDAISIESAPPGQLGPPAKNGSKGGGSKGNSTQLGFGKLKANLKNGTAILPVKVPEAGKLTAQAKKLIKPVVAQAASARTIKLRLTPTPAALATLRKKHKLRVKLAVAYAPKTGAVEKTTVPVVLKLQAPRHRGR